MHMGCTLPEQGAGGCRAWACRGAAGSMFMCGASRAEVRAQKQLAAGSWLRAPQRESVPHMQRLMRLDPHVPAWAQRMSGGRRGVDGSLGGHRRVDLVRMGP